MYEIKIGCCGWSYEDWKGVFYPPDSEPGEYLGFYARQFDVVEVDSTFYRTPSRRMVEAWRARTPEHFRFSLKLPQVITHEKVLGDCAEELEAFLEVARLLGEKLLCVCLQFGYFNRQRFSSLQAFLNVLDPFLERWPRDVPLAVEIRNRNWLRREWTECLRRHEAATVLAQQRWMPSPARLMEELDVATGLFGYVRLLGDRKEIEQITTTWNRVVLDRTYEIHSAAQAVRRLARQLPVFVFANNHYAGYAPGTAQTLQQHILKGGNTYQ